MARNWASLSYPERAASDRAAGRAIVPFAPVGALRAAKFVRESRLRTPGERVCSCCGVVRWWPGYDERCPGCALEASVAGRRA